MTCESEFVCATFFCAYLGFAILNYFNAVSLATWCTLWTSVRFLEATVYYVSSQKIPTSRSTVVPLVPPPLPSSASEDTDPTSLAVPPLPDEEVGAITSEIQRLSTPTTWRRWQSRFPQTLQPKPRPSIKQSSKKGLWRIFCCYRG
ncbi:hypothetical protein EmuJ_000357400 [Echinococcus multilocularis]|uniref:Uncharacterized protein n=1 Tax=Echinococcus multilocularis TaxID=6211 RepID=A0A068Y304_ECHMU|nr:hypothetical protein EmuJ_000357400 [Echinococcus multilocularis]